MLRGTAYCFEPSPLSGGDRRPEFSKHVPFLHVGDCADALVFLRERYSGETQINIDWGEDVSITGACAGSSKAISKRH
jgi:hypothetical protein